MVCGDGDGDGDRDGDRDGDGDGDGGGVETAMVKMIDMLLPLVSQGCW